MGLPKPLIDAVKASAADQHIPVSAASFPPPWKKAAGSLEPSK